MMMSPPLPPSPPSGPPMGTRCSRLNDVHPDPPVPASTRTVTRSTNIQPTIPFSYSKHSESSSEGDASILHATGASDTAPILPLQSNCPTRQLLIRALQPAHRC